MVFLAGLTPESLNDWDKEYKDLALVSLAAYGPPSAPRYAAIWLPSLRRDKTEKRRQFLPLLEAAPTKDALTNYLGLEPGRYHPIGVTATGDIRGSGESGVHVTWVLEEQPKPLPLKGTIARVKGSIGALIKDMGEKRCAAMDAVWYYPPGKQRKSKNMEVSFLGVFQPNPQAVFGVFQSPTGEYAPDTATGAMYAPIAIKARASYKRVHTAIPAATNTEGKRRIVYHMRGDSYATWPEDENLDFLGGTVTDGPLRQDQLEYYCYLRRDMVPIQVGANGIGTHLRFCITWAPKQRPKARYFWAIDGADDGPPQVAAPPKGPAPFGRSFQQFGQFGNQDSHDALASMRKEVESTMRARNISNAQVAIAVDGKLKLMWSLTMAENGWRMTQPNTKLRFGSSVKLLVAMMAVGLGENFLGSRIRDILDLPRPDGLDDTEWNRFSSATVEEYLWHLSGLSTSVNLANVTWKFGQRELPLVQGDIRQALAGGALPGLQQYFPGVVEDYDNTGFALLGELLSLSRFESTGAFLLALHEWASLGANHIRRVPRNRNESRSAGEPPIRSPECVARNTRVSLKNELEELGQLPPFVPGGYDFRDYSLFDSAGNIIMSAAVMARLLQRLHPAESMRSNLPNRLTDAQISRLRSKSPNLVLPVIAKDTLGTMPQPPNFCLAGEVITSGGTIINPTVVHDLRWGGTLKSGRSTWNHVQFGGNPMTARTLSVTFVTNTNSLLGSYDDSFIRKRAEEIFLNGGWDTQEDLFPELGLV